MRIATGLFALAMLAACDRFGLAGNQATQTDTAGSNSIAPALPTAGPGDKPVAENQRGAMQPGLWRSTSEVVEMNIPNLPAGMSPPQMPRTAENRCFSAAEAANPSFAMLAGNAQAGCTTDRFSFTNGRMEAVSTCTANGIPTRLTMDGYFSPTTYVMIVSTSAQTAGMTISTRLRVAGERVGDCPAR